MKINKMLVVTAVAGLAAFGFASEDAKQMMRVQHGMDIYCQAMKHHDMGVVNRTIGAYFAPDVVFVDMHGKKSNLAQWKQSLEGEMKALTSVDDLRLHCDSFTSKGNSASGGEHFHMKAKVRGQSSKQLATLLVDTVNHLEYQKRNGKWLVVKSTQVKNLVLINGKAVPM